MVAQVGEPPTIPADDSGSQPSTSTGTAEAMHEVEPEKDPSSDSDASIGWADYEHRKDVIVKKLVLCDQLLNRIRVTAKHTRLKDYERRKEHLASRDDAEYLERIAAIEIEIEKEQDKLRTGLELELASLERVNKGERDFIARGYRDRLQYKKSQALYANQLKVDELLKRIWKEDEVRADLRIFVGQDVPDEWLDEFIKSYVDELEERENSEDAVRERNRLRYRKEAGESLDTGAPLSEFLDQVHAERLAHPNPMKPAPRVLYQEQERLLKQTEAKKEREKLMKDKLKRLKHINVDRFFPDQSRPESVRVERTTPGDMIKLEDLDAEVPIMKRKNFNWKKTKKSDNSDLLKMKAEFRKKCGVREKPKRRPEVITIDDGDEGDMNPRTTAVNSKKQIKRRTIQELQKLRETAKKIVLRKNEAAREKKELFLEERRNKVKKLERKGEELLRQKMALEESEESGSDGDIATTMRQGVQAVLMTYGNGNNSTPSTPRGEKRVGRLKKALREMLEMKRESRVDPDLQRARDVLVCDFMDEKLVKGMKQKMKLRKQNEKWQADRQEDDDHIEERLRDAALVKGLVNKSLKRPIIGGEWMDENERASRAMEAVSKRKTEVNTHFLTVKERQFDKKNKKKSAVDSESDWEDETKEKKRLKKKNGVQSARRKDSTDSEYYYAQIDYDKTPNGMPLTERELMEQEKRMREIRAVIAGKDPKSIDHSASREKEMDEEIDVVEIVEDLEDTKKEKKEVNGKVKKAKTTNGRRRPLNEHDCYDDDDEDYGNHSKKYGSTPAYRIASRPPQQPRLNLQLSEARILQDLYRSGALRQRETYGDYIERIDRERNQRLLSSLPSTSQDGTVGLLSPRSQRALEQFPHEAMEALTNEERQAFLDELPSTSKERYQESSDEEEEDDNDDDSDDDSSEGWELEEDDEETRMRKQEQELIAFMNMNLRHNMKEIKEEEDDDDEMMEVDDSRFDDEDVYNDGDEEVEEVAEAEVMEETEAPRTEEMEEFSPQGTETATPLLEGSSTKKKSTPRMNGFSRTGKTTVA